MSIAFIFPGLSIRPPTLAMDLSGSHPVYDLVGRQLGFSLVRAVASGRTDTSVLQSAIFCQSAVVFDALRCAGIRPDFVAGHSLGETAAMVAAGAIEQADAMRLVVARARVLREIEQDGLGSMALVLIGSSSADEYAFEQGVDRMGLEIAVHNGPGNFVLAGSTTALGALEADPTQLAVRRMTDLGIPAPYHSRLMAPAARRIQELLCDVPIRTPTIPVIGNSTAAQIKSAAEVEDLLAHQVCRTVQWHRTVELLISLGVNQFVEVGANSLTGLVRRISGDVDVLSVMDQQTLCQAIESLARV